MSIEGELGVADLVPETSHRSGGIGRIEPSSGDVTVLGAGISAASTRIGNNADLDLDSGPPQQARPSHGDAAVVARSRRTGGIS